MSDDKDAEIARLRAEVDRLTDEALARTNKVAEMGAQWRAKEADARKRRAKTEIRDFESMALAALFIGAAIATPRA